MPHILVSGGFSAAPWIWAQHLPGPGFPGPGFPGTGFPGTGFPDASFPGTSFPASGSTTSFMPVVVIAGIVLVAVFGYIGYALEKKRREEMSALAEELGLTFDPNADSSHDDRYAQFDIFRRGHSRVAKNTLTGTIELFDRTCRLVTGDFRYKVTSGSGKNRSTRTYNFSYLIVHPPWDTPPLLIRPEGVWDKIKGAVGFDDIDFESDEFSRKFYVQSSDRKFAYDMLHPRMMEFLLEHPTATIDIENGALCLSNGLERWTPDRFRSAIVFVHQFCERWPRHLVKEFES